MTYAKIKISGARGCEEAQLLVDTGLNFTWVPADKLERIGVESKSIRRFRTIEGQGDRAEGGGGGPGTSRGTCDKYHSLRREGRCFCARNLFSGRARLGSRPYYEAVEESRGVHRVLRNLTIHCEEL